MAVRQLRADPVADVRGEHGEGPAWDERAGHLLWVDMLAGGLHHTRSDGSDEVTDYDQPVCVAVPRAGGGLALALGDGLWLEEPGGERRRSVRDPPAGRPGPHPHE